MGTSANEGMSHLELKTPERIAERGKTAREQLQGEGKQSVS